MAKKKKTKTIKKTKKTKRAKNLKIKPALKTTEKKSLWKIMKNIGI